MFSCNVLSVIFTTGASPVKFLFIIPHNEIFHGGIISWSDIQNSSRLKGRESQSAYMTDNIIYQND